MQRYIVDELQQSGNACREDKGTQSKKNKNEDRMSEFCAYCWGLELTNDSYRMANVCAI